MRKISVYFACFFVLIVMGCGNTSDDPTARITALSADPEAVAPGGSTVITATVIRAGGTTTTTTGTTTTTTATSSGWGENVTFTLLTANGARLSTVTQKADGAGIATTVYTAGNNYNQDVIQATLDNGMSASIVITKTGNVSGASIKITEPATSPASVNAFGYVSIVATVTESNDTDKPMSGQTVEFKLVENNSGATLIVLNAVTDASGRAIATYRAGGKFPAQDVVQAKVLSNGSVSSVVIDVTAGSPGVSIEVAASPASVSAGQVSIVTATLTGDEMEGVTVTFTLPINSSGATLSAATATTDGSGKAVVTYQAGTASPALSVSDTVQAAVGSVSSIAVITRTGSSTSAFSITVTPSPQTLTSKTSSSVLTATVKNNLGTAASGATVTFTATRGSLSVLSATTDGSGNAVTTFTGDGGSPGTGVVTASVTVGGNTYTSAVVVNIP